jgi:hypothetical protein
MREERMVERMIMSEESLSVRCASLAVICELENIGGEAEHGEALDVRFDWKLALGCVFADVALCEVCG